MGENNVCLKSRTLLTCLLEKNPMSLNFLFGGTNFFFGGGGSFMGGDIEDDFNLHWHDISGFACL